LKITRLNQNKETTKINELMKNYIMKSLFISGKCEQDFLNYCVENKERLFNRILCDDEDVLDELNYLLPISVLPLIIEFLDTKKHEDEPLYSMCFDSFYKYKIESQSQFDIWIKSIELANKLYNFNCV
jgi:hypothetical protein